MSQFTYGDYLEFPAEERWELIEGVAYDMTPAPCRLHQRVVVELTYQVRAFLGEGGPCEVYVAPFDVRLPAGDEPDEDVSTVVQPDIVVVCDRDKLDERGCRGAPDFVIEVVSPSSVQRDNIAKVALYERAGVREYWIVHPVDGLVVTRVLNAQGTFSAPVYHEARGRVAAAVLPGLALDFDRLLEGNAARRGGARGRAARRATDLSSVGRPFDPGQGRARAGNHGSPPRAGATDRSRGSAGGCRCARALPRPCLPCPGDTDSETVRRSSGMSSPVLR